MNKPIAIDLFSGVGGMSLGIKQAGFRVIGAFDAESLHIRTYKKNFPSVKAHAIDLARTTSSELRRLSQCQYQDIDLVFGGPPCQGFSIGGHRKVNDDRNLLVFDFIRLVRGLRPKYFILENVQGLLSKRHEITLDLVLKRSKLAGYRMTQDIRVLNAADFGVPQRRKRVFILGYRSDCAPIFYPEPIAIRNCEGKDYQPVVSDALDDLPVGNGVEYLFNQDRYDGLFAEPSSHYAKLMRNLIQEEGDRYSKYRAPTKILTGCLRTRHDPEVIRRFRDTMPGSVEPISRYIRLSSSGLAPTLRAGTGPERGSHTSPRPIHPIEPRCITVREGARLHSFPDWFQFHAAKWHAFRQIGNSVPPRLARAVGQAVHAAIF